MIKNNLSSISELEFWDEKLSVDGSVVISERIKAVNELSFEAQGVHSAMSGVEEMLSFQYKPSVNILDNVNKDQISKSLLESLANFRGKDISRGATQLGPHRDDMRTLVDGTDAERYASRGQARTAVLSLKMAEARFLLKRRGNEPILLMDDFLSELDSIRRNQVIEHTLQYEQCIITTSEPDSIPIKFGKTSNKLIVSEGNIISSGGTT
jgi:DNA replication and repair protein RecF